MLDDAKSLFAVKEDEQEQIAPEPLEEEIEETGFAPEPTPEPEPEPASSQPETQQTQQPGFVPLAAVLDEREKRQKLERDLEEARAVLARFNQQQQAGEAPSIYDDPVAYQQSIEARLEAQAFQIREQMSERFATQVHGAEALEAAKQWGIETAKNDPYFKARFVSQADPFGWLIAEQQRDLVAKDPAAFARKWAEENGYAPIPQQAQQPAPVQPVARPAAPPRSIASAPSSSGVTHTPVNSALEAMKFNL